MRGTKFTAPGHSGSRDPDVGTKSPCDDVRSVREVAQAHRRDGSGSGSKKEETYIAARKDPKECEEKADVEGKKSSRN